MSLAERRVMGRQGLLLLTAPVAGSRSGAVRFVTLAALPRRSAGKTEDDPSRLSHLVLVLFLNPIDRRFGACVLTLVSPVIGFVQFVCQRVFAGDRQLRMLIVNRVTREVDRLVEIGLGHIRDRILI